MYQSDSWYDISFFSQLTNVTQFNYIALTRFKNHFYLVQFFCHLVSFSSPGALINNNIVPKECFSSYHLTLESHSFFPTCFVTKLKWLPFNSKDLISSFSHMKGFLLSKRIDDLASHTLAKHSYYDAKVAQTVKRNTKKSCSWK